MNLTLQTDYALRILLYLGASPNETCSVASIASAFDISHNHLVKVARLLTRLGYVRTVRGRTGGLRLAKEAHEIHVGDVVRQTEPTFDIVECFHRAPDSCRLVKHCSLKQALIVARDAFLEALGGVTLASLLHEPALADELVGLRILGRSNEHTENPGRAANEH